MIQAKNRIKAPSKELERAATNQPPPHGRTPMSVVTVVLLLIILGLQMFDSYTFGTNQKIFEAHFLRLDKRIGELARLSEHNVETSSSGE